MVERCSAIDGTWGLRAENVEMAKKIAKPLMETVAKSDAELVAGDCHLVEHRDQGGDGQGAVAPAPGAGPRLRARHGRSDDEEADHRRHQGPARVRARTRRVPGRDHHDEEEAPHPLGDLITIVFENTDTMRFQIQEMARGRADAQRRADRARGRDLQRADPRRRASSRRTLFIEITDDQAAARVAARVSSASRTTIAHRGRRRVRSRAASDDMDRLTREDEITTTVHYLKFAFTDAQRAAFADGPVRHRGRPPGVRGSGRR